MLDQRRASFGRTKGRAFYDGPVPTTAAVVGSLLTSGEEKVHEATATLAPGILGGGSATLAEVLVDVDEAGPPPMAGDTSALLDSSALLDGRETSADLLTCAEDMQLDIVRRKTMQQLDTSPSTSTTAADHNSSSSSRKGKRGLLSVSISPGGGAGGGHDPAQLSQEKSTSATAVVSPGSPSSSTVDGSDASTERTEASSENEVIPCRPNDITISASECLLNLRSDTDTPVIGGNVFSKDGTHLAMGHRDSVKIYNVTTWALTAIGIMNSAHVLELRWSAERDWDKGESWEQILRCATRANKRRRSRWSAAHDEGFYLLDFSAGGLLAVAHGILDSCELRKRCVAKSVVVYDHQFTMMTRLLCTDDSITRYWCVQASFSYGEAGERQNSKASFFSSSDDPLERPPGDGGPCEGTSPHTRDSLSRFSDVHSPYLVAALAVEVVSVFETKTWTVIQNLTRGGDICRPFFSPDNRWLCVSDRLYKVQPRLVYPELEGNLSLARLGEIAAATEVAKKFEETMKHRREQLAATGGEGEKKPLRERGVGAMRAVRGIDRMFKLGRRKSVPSFQRALTEGATGGEDSGGEQACEEKDLRHSEADPDHTDHRTTATGRVRGESTIEGNTKWQRLRQKSGSTKDPQDHCGSPRRREDEEKSRSSRLTARAAGIVAGIVTQQSSRSRRARRRSAML